MNKKLNFILKEKKIYKIILYLFTFFIIIFSVYFFIPKFFNYTPKLIQESLNKNNNINIKDISDIKYKFFPSPRLTVAGINLELEENILKVENAEVDIILNPLSIINYKVLDYKKLIIKKGSSIIKTNQINKLFKYIKKNKKKIDFQENTIIVMSQNKRLFEINDSLIKINNKNSFSQLNLNGLFLNQKIFFTIKKKSERNTNIILKIPTLDIKTELLLKNTDISKTFEGLVNFKILNNLIQFNFTKKKNILINKGFIRSSLVNSSFDGELYFKPYFFFNLNLEPSTFNIKKLILFFQKKYFFEDSQEIEAIKGLDGFLNFKNLFNGNIIFKNREILFQNFQVGKNFKISFDAKISEFGKKGKIRFNLKTNILSQNNSAKDIEISGFLTPLSSKVIFEKIAIKKETLTTKQIKNYEKKFNYELIDNSISNIFNEKKMNNFFKILKN